MVKIRVAKASLKSSFPWVKKDAVYKEDYRLLSQLTPGDVVELVLKDESYYAYFCGEKILFKIFSQQEKDLAVAFQGSLESALRLRKSLKINSNAVRLFFSEADGFPGVTIDQYDDLAVVSVASEAILKHRSALSEIIKKVSGLQPIWLPDRRSDDPQSRIIFEADCKFFVDFERCHKTGFYLDQRKNRYEIREFVTGSGRVLDLFCYTGGFGVHCWKNGAKEIVFVDEGKAVVEVLEENLRLNKISKAKVFRRDVFEFLNGCEYDGYFDLVICDPPAFTSSRENISSAVWGYKKLLRGILRVVRNGGFFAIFSCSWHVNLDILIQAVAETARELRVTVKIVKHLFQDSDHPFLATFPPSLYLKGLLCHVEKT